MTRIGADTTHLYETVAALRQGSSNIESALQQAMRGMEALQNSRWSGQHRQQAEAIWAHIQGQFVPTIEALNELAARTERFANALEEAGREFGNEIVTISASGGLSWWETVRGRTLLKELLKEGIVRDLYEARVVTSKLHSMRTLRFERGFAYPGEVIISGSHKAKEAAYLKVKTTHMKADVINALKKQTPGIKKDALGKKALGMTALFAAIEEGVENWEEYKSDSQAVQKIVVGTAIDTSVTTACSVAGAAIGSCAGAAVLGTALGAMSGGLLAPVGVAIGSRLGGVVGGIAGDWVADKIQESEWYTQNKEVWVQQGADAIDWTIKHLDAGKEALVDGGKKALDAGKEAFQSAPN